MITDTSNGRLNEIKTYAKENNLEQNLNNAFSRLSITNNGKLILNGGLIYHGSHDGLW